MLLGIVFWHCKKMLNCTNIVFLRGQSRDVLTLWKSISTKYKVQVWYICGLYQIWRLHLISLNWQNFSLIWYSLIIFIFTFFYLLYFVICVMTSLLKIHIDWSIWGFRLIRSSEPVCVYNITLTWCQKYQ